MQQLPPGWYTAQDPQTGQTVYCNQQTGQCQWEPPDAAASYPMQQSASSPAPGWYVTTDPASGQTYYCNEQTGKCSLYWPPE